MIGKARGAGLVFDDAAVKAHPLEPDPCAALHNSKTGFYRLTAGIDRAIGWTIKNPDASDDRQARRPDAIGARQRASALG